MARPKKLYSDKGLTEDQKEIREMAMSNLAYFVALVAKQRVLGHCHIDMLKELSNNEILNLLILWPRGHQKSTMLAYYAAWRIICQPDVTIMYVSATSDLANAQLDVIKSILTSNIVMKYWHGLINEDEGKRERWRSDEIMVDHWKRKEEVIRDPTIKTVGMGGNIVGFHCDELLLDDLVVDKNAETKTERDKVKRYFSLLTSILNPGGHTKAVGTRYHQNDLYQDLMDMKEDIFDEKGVLIDERPMFSFSAKVVEEDGEYLWPRTKREDGKWFGFDKKELSRIKRKYIDKAQFFAQYYNDPSDPTNKRITEFNYYERNCLKKEGRYWSINGRRLNVYAAIDFAATMRQKADYTAIVVAGMDQNHKVYVLDISRMKTDKISEMQAELTKLYDKWNWLKLHAEAAGQQNLAVEQIKEFNRKQGIYYNIEKTVPQIEKQLRIMSTLEPRYVAGDILHYRGGYCQILEDELMSTKPPHDDVSDAFASCVEVMVAPTMRAMNKKVSNISTHPQFGGIRF